MAPHLCLSQHVQGDLYAAAVLSAGQTGKLGQLQIHLALAPLTHAGDLHHLGEGHGLPVGSQSAPCLLDQQLELHCTLEYQLAADKLTLPAHRLGLTGHYFHALPLAAVEADLVGEGKGLLLDGAELIGLRLGDHLLHLVLLRLQHSLAAHVLRGLEGGDFHRQVHPQQYLSGIEGPGLRAPYPGAGGYHPLLGERGGIHLAGKGQGGLQTAQSASLLRLVEYHRPHTAAGLGQSIPCLLAVQGGLGTHGHDTQNVRTGIGHDGLQSFLLAHRPACRHFVAVGHFPVKFQFHTVLSLFLECPAAAGYPALGHYMRRRCRLCPKTVAPPFKPTGLKGGGPSRLPMQAK